MSTIVEEMKRKEWKLKLLFIFCCQVAFKEMYLLSEKSGDPHPGQQLNGFKLSTMTQSEFFSQPFLKMLKTFEC